MWRLILLSLGSLVAAPAAWTAAAPVTDALAAIRVQDLHYGDVLFRFYSGDDFEALTRLEAYEHWQRMPHHEQDAALLAGGLYLSLGMHNEAGRRFETLLNDQGPAGLRNRARVYLAKGWDAPRYYDRSGAS